MHTLTTCQALDQADALRPLRDQFILPQGMIYLDGNSLGVLPKATPARVADVVQQQWGEGLIQSWNQAGWVDLPQRVGNKIARLLGAQAGEVVVADSTSVNLFKALSHAIQLAQHQRPLAKVVLSERTNFPTDLYMAQALCHQHGLTLQLVDAHELLTALKPDVGVLMLTHVNYRTGAMHDMPSITAAAHAVGALTVWDLAHSAGAVPVDLHGAQADFAVGCGYKYLNGGPGAPAFVWVHPKHFETAAGRRMRFAQPLAGWWGHEAPFVFDPHYRPAPGITSYQCGTQPIISLVALECGVDSVLAAEAYGGMAALRAKSLALCDLMMALVAQRCSDHGLTLLTPQDPAQRGSQVSFARDKGGYAIMQALIARGVVGDFRQGDGGQHPDILRFGLTPMYVGFADVWHAVEHLRQVLETREWQRPEFNRQHAVT